MRIFSGFRPYSSVGFRRQLLRLLAGVGFAITASDLAVAGQAQGGTVIAKDLLVFDIAPQVLPAALNRYGDLTGREVLYDTALAQGRVSAAVHGVLTPETALARLLDGTGLQARFMPEGSFVLIPGSGGEPRVQTTAPAKAEAPYYGRIQTSIRQALCTNVSGRAGRYRVAALLWIGPAGKVTRYERLSNVSNSETDRVVDETLRDLQIGSPPPEGFRQPVLAAVVPKGPGVTLDCDHSRNAQRAAEARP